MDRWILHRMGAALRRDPAAVVVDLGFGASPVTTLELADRLARHLGRPARVVGIEIDPARVADAQSHARDDVSFRRGGFEVPLDGSAHATVIRAANVLRQYDEGDVPEAWAAMRDRLVPGGILLEGTCDELGRLAAWVSVQGQDGGTDPVAPQALTLSLDLRTLDRPSRVAERLPKALIHRNVSGEHIHEFLGALDRAWLRAAPLSAFGPRQRWLATVGEVLADGWPVQDGRARWRLGEVTVPWSSVAQRGTGPGTPADD